MLEYIGHIGRFCLYRRLFVECLVKFNELLFQHGILLRWMMTAWILNLTDFQSELQIFSELHTKRNCKCIAPISSKVSLVIDLTRFQWKASLPVFCDNPKGGNHCGIILWTVRDTKKMLQVTVKPAMSFVCRIVERVVYQSLWTVPSPCSSVVVL